MGPYLASAFGDEPDCGAGHSLRSGAAAMRPRRPRQGGLRGVWAGAAFLLAASAIAGGAQPLVPRAQAAPDPRVEYLYDVAVRRQYNFPNNDAVGYGYGICDKVSGGEGYAQVMGDVKRDVTPNDEFAANYLVSYAVNLLCPAQIWQLRNSAAHYQPPPGA
jgi:hypothetical protein